MKAYTLVEALLVAALISVLVAITIPVVVKAQRWCKEWAYGAWAWQENRIEAFCNDRSSEGLLLMYATNKPARWSFDVQPTQ